MSLLSQDLERARAWATRTPSNLLAQHAAWRLDELRAVRDGDLTRDPLVVTFRRHEVRTLLQEAHRRGLPLREVFA